MHLEELAMKYRKKSVLVEVSQWWKPGDHAAVTHPVPANVLWPSAHDAEAHARFGAIKTLEGWMLVSPGDYIVCGVRGEHYACKPDIFLETYEPAEGEPAA
jgi:hypothetical protein